MVIDTSTWNHLITLPIDCWKLSDISPDWAIILHKHQRRGVMSWLLTWRFVNKYISFLRRMTQLITSSEPKGLSIFADHFFYIRNLEQLYKLVMFMGNLAKMYTGEFFTRHCYIALVYWSFKFWCCRRNILGEIYTQHNQIYAPARYVTRSSPEMELTVWDGPRLHTPRRRSLSSMRKSQLTQYVIMALLLRPLKTKQQANTKQTHQNNISNHWFILQTENLPIM